MSHLAAVLEGSCEDVSQYTCKGLVLVFDFGPGFPLLVPGAAGRAAVRFCVVVPLSLSLSLSSTKSALTVLFPFLQVAAFC